MKYAVYFEKDYHTDSTIVTGAKKRDLVIADTLKNGDFDNICWCKIYASGEYGRRTFVKGSAC